MRACLRAPMLKSTSHAPILKIKEETVMTQPGEAQGKGGRRVVVP